jgi:hypothetical protein
MQQSNLLSNINVYGLFFILLKHVNVYIFFYIHAPSLNGS